MSAANLSFPTICGMATNFQNPLLSQRSGSSFSHSTSNSHSFNPGTVSLMSTMFKQQPLFLFRQTRNLDKQFQTISSIKSAPEIRKPSVLSFRNIAYAETTVPPNWSHKACTTRQVALLHPVLMLLSSYQQPPVPLTCDVRDKSSNLIECKDSVYVKDNNHSPKLDNSWNVGSNSSEYGYDNDNDHHNNCELAYESDIDSESDEDDWSEDEDERSVCNESDDDSVVEFTNEFSPIQQKDVGISTNHNQLMCPVKNLCVPVLNHTSSFSSEESGFCEQNQSDWSDDETDCEECPFDEGLWHLLEEQACFNLSVCTNTKKQVSKTCSMPTSSVTVTPSSIAKKPDSVTMHIINTTQSDVTPKDNDIHNSTSHCTTVTTSCDGTLSCECRCENMHCCSTRHLTPSSNSGKHVQKKVTFKPECELVEVYPVIHWDRKGPWEQFAVDRDRFWKRIESMEKIIGPCLKRKLSTHTCTGLK